MAPTQTTGWAIRANSGSGITESRLQREGDEEEKQVGFQPHGGRHVIRHGGQLSALRERYPEAPEPLIDLSTGINPFPYPLPPIPETAYTRLPEETHIRDLREAAAAAYGVKRRGATSPSRRAPSC